MKKELLQLAKAIVLGILALFMLTVTVLEIFPGAKTPLEIKDSVTVAPSLLNSNGDKYQLLMTGTLTNRSNERVTVDSLDVRVTNGRDDYTVRIPISTVLEPRENYYISYAVESTASYSRVKSVSALTSTETIDLTNSTEASFGTTTVILLAITAIVGYFLYRAILVYYYMQLEKKQMQ